MEFLIYFLVSLVSFLGLPAGVILSLVSPEEMPTGRRLFPLLQKIALVAIAAIIIRLFASNFYARLPLYAFAILAVNLKISPAIIYPLLAVPFFLASSDQNAFLAIAALVFVYGLPTGSLYQGKSKACAATYALKKVSFILLAASLYLIQAA